MTSLFDTLVRRRREHTPWARMSVSAFLQAAAWNGASSKRDEASKPATLTVVYRGDVASRLWYTLEWAGEDGERHQASAQELDLVLWRAAEMELAARERVNQPKEVGPTFTFQCPECGGGKFGSVDSRPSNSVLERFCHGSCAFRWMEVDDYKYFLVDGVKLSREAYADAERKLKKEMDAGMAYPFFPGQEP